MLPPTRQVACTSQLRGDGGNDQAVLRSIPGPTLVLRGGPHPLPSAVAGRLTSLDDAHPGRILDSGQTPVRDAHEDALVESFLAANQSG